MTREEFLINLDELADLPPGTLRGPEKLEDLGDWTSLSIIGFIALADTHNGARLELTQVAKCLTVEDLLKVAKVDSAT